MYQATAAFRGQRWILSATIVLTFVLASTTGAAADGARGSGNYLIVLAQDYDGSDALNEFAAAKTAQGFHVATYVVSPGTSNTAIQSYIQSLWGTGAAPDYLLLIGDSDGSTASSSTIPHFTGEASRQAACDLYYTCMDGGDDWYPEFPVGRFSVRDPNELQVVVDKSLFVEAGVFDDPDYVKRAAFLATNDTTAGAEGTHDFVIDNYMTPNDFTCTKIYAAEGGGTADITAAVNNGCLFTTYFGHSGSTGWSTPSFHQTEVRALTNEGLYGLVFGFSCNTANWPGGECFGETWILERDSGAAAYLSASDYIFWGTWEAWEPARQLEKYFYRAVFADGYREVGPAWLRALSYFLADYGSVPGNEDVTRNFFEEMVLLGDPSLYLPEGWGFTFELDTYSQSLCSPPTDEAVYTIDVQPTGDFDEAVTLTAAGEPSGATVSFSVNNAVPPFISEMTVSNVSGDSPGAFTIIITGTAPTFERSTSVDLNLSTTTPGSVSLVSPIKNAVEVSRKPTLVWTAATQATEYDVEIATDSGFANIVYTATATDTQHTLTTRLDPLTDYYWHIRGVNGCGDGAFSQSRRFTTLEQAEYFTEEFTSGFDLDYISVTFIPDGSGDYYRMCSEDVTEFPTDPTGGTVISPGEDGYVQVFLQYSQTVQLYNLGYTDFYVGSNGYITFGSGDGDWDETLAEHFSLPRIALLYDDLSPQNGGTVSWIQLGDRAVVTYEDVPEYNTTNSNNFQVEMFYDGDIRITWLGMAADEGIVGLSAGDGLPDDYIESDLSAATPCGPGFYITADPDAQSVCAPADAVYTIEVQEVQSFTEPVTLSTSGEPAGTTVDFSVNSQVPPFTSVMTVSGTGAASPGDYFIEVIGTATAGVQSTTVDLNLADDTPGIATLTSPANGALNVALSPTFTWDAASQAAEYQIEIATDSGFATIVESGTVYDTMYTASSILASLTEHFWRVRASNACGAGDYSATFSFTTLDTLEPTAYDMLNGETGTYTYFDDLYDGDGNNDAALAPLSNGLGDLTDGVMADHNWDETNVPYVGWRTVDPTITFHFNGWVRVRTITLYVDDSNGGGGVYPPQDVTVSDGVNTLEFPITDPPSGAPFAIELDELGLVGDTIEVTLADHNASGGYMMLSEVEFNGGPCPADLDRDGDVDLADLATLLGNYGAATGASYDMGDLDGDGDVDLGDLAALLGLYGTVYD